MTSDAVKSLSVTGDHDALSRRVRPSDWSNPRPRAIYDLAVVGAGPAGIEAARYARRLGLSVALVERDRLGGVSLNAGTIPSKTLIQTARLCAHIRDGADFGIDPPAEVELNFAALRTRSILVRARIAESFSVDRLRLEGIDIFFGDARFSARDALGVGDLTLRFGKAILATGARPRRPDIPGLDAVGYRTSADIFEMTDLPRRLVVVGGGPLGCEMAQAFRRLGSNVTIIQNDPKFLPREERDAAQLLSESLARDGVAIMLNTIVTGAHVENGEKFVDAIDYDRKISVPTDEILLSVGRTPNVESLRLETAGIEWDAKGVKTDDFLRTANPNVFAAGDVCMSRKFTHVARETARMAVRNAVEKTRMRRSALTIPWCTYCEPEIAHVGMQVWEARSSGMAVKTYAVMMHDDDRAITDGKDEGFVKIHVRDGAEEIVGATIVSTRASELINEVCVAMRAGMGMRELADVIHTYPALSEAIRTAASAFEKRHPARGDVAVVVSDGSKG